MKTSEYLPAGWKFYRFGDIAKFTRELFQVEPTESYRELTLRLYGNGFEIRREVAGAALVADKMQRMKTGQLVTSIHQFRNGAVGIVPQELAGAILSKNFLVYDLDSKVVDAAFLLRFLTAPSSIYFFQANSTGSATPIFPKAMIEEVEIPLPPLAEQRRVVARIEELAAQIHEARTLRHQAAEETEALTKSTLNQELTAAAKKFGVQPMGAVAKCAAGFGFPKQHQGRRGLKYPFAKVSDMNLPANQRAITTAQNWVGDDDVRELRLKIYPVGTIIFPKIGGAIATNKRRVLSLPATFDNNVMGLIPSEKLSSEYLFAFMQSFDLTELQAGTSVPAISQGKVEAMEIPVPPLAEQRRIVAELDALQAEVDALKRLQAGTAAELDALLPAILDRAFKGEL